MSRICILHLAEFYDFVRGEYDSSKISSEVLNCPEIFFSFQYCWPACYFLTVMKIWYCHWFNIDVPQNLQYSDCI